MTKFMDFNEIGNIIIEKVNEVCINYEEASKKVKHFDNEMTDFLHDLELEATTVSDRSKLATKMRKNRIARREEKDITEHYFNIYNFLSQGNNKKIVMLFAEELKRNKKLDENRNQRQYVKRVR